MSGLRPSVACPSRTCCVTCADPGASRAAVGGSLRISEPSRATDYHTRAPPHGAVPGRSRCGSGRAGRRRRDVPPDPPRGDIPNALRAVPGQQFGISSAVAVAHPTAPFIRAHAGIRVLRDGASAWPGARLAPRSHAALRIVGEVSGPPHIGPPEPCDARRPATMTHHQFPLDRSVGCGSRASKGPLGKSAERRLGGLRRL